MRILFKDSPYHGQRQYQKPVWIYPAHLAMYATYLKNATPSKVVWFGEDDGTFDQVIDSDLQIPVDFEKLPIPDRIFTNSMNPKYTCYGNYKLNGTHFLSSNLCWWAGQKGCVFCVDSKRIVEGEHRGVRSVDHVISEIEDCVRVGHKEAFDDAGTIPINQWLHDFCHAMIKTGLNKKISIGCNLKPIRQDFKLMKEAGFRFILVGVESANQRTIDKIQKGQDCARVVENLKAMSDAGLEPHATFMVSYEWETHEENMNTVRLAHHLLRKGYAKTAQASVYMPPRTAPDPNAHGQKYVQKIYDIYKDPRYWFRKLLDLRRVEDLTYLLKRIGHVKHAE